MNMALREMETVSGMDSDLDLDLDLVSGQESGLDLESDLVRAFGQETSSVHSCTFAVHFPANSLCS